MKNNVSRFPASIRYWQKEMLRIRDCHGGDLVCLVCGVCESERQLDIDHIDGDPLNNAPENIRLLCHSCNLKAKYGNLKLNKKSGEGVSEMCMSEKKNTDTGRVQVVDLTTGSLELHTNREKEPMYRQKLIEFVFCRESVTVKEALTEVPEIVKCSPVTARRYLEKMVSASGPLMIGTGPRGKQRLIPRPGYFENTFNLKDDEQKKINLELEAIKFKEQ